MQVWERINEIRDENMSLEEMVEKFLDDGFCVAYKNYPLNEDCKFLELVEKFCNEHKFCTDNGDYCDECLERFLKLRYDDGKGMKYSKEIYEETDFYGIDEDIENRKQKIVICRKPHICCNCGKEIQVGENALNETAIIREEGFKSCYTCIDCCDKWLDE